LTLSVGRATLQSVSVAASSRLEAHEPGVDAAPRLGLAYPGDPESSGTWSGTPASLGGALRELGATVVPLRAEPPRAVEWAAAHLLTLARVHRTPGATLRQRVRTSRGIALYMTPSMSRLRSRALRRPMTEALPLQGVVQVGTGYAVPAGAPVATYEDMTVRQALELPYPEWQALSDRETGAAVERQARAYARAAACCFATDWAAQSAVRDYGVARERARVVGIGRNHTPRPVSRDWGSPRFLFVGGDWRRKNGDAVVRAFARVRERFPTARLDLSGHHPRVDVNGVTGHGWLSLGDESERAKLDRLFENATCFVMPSRVEPAGIVYLEAGAAGVPCIGTTVGGCTELIGEGGTVVDPHDERALVDAMLRFSDGAAAQEAGRRALDRADHFTWEAVARRLLDALDLAPREGAQ
jgi:glycosyltransferase involved in cell wall biosynthesis